MNRIKVLHDHSWTNIEKVVYADFYLQNRMKWISKIRYTNQIYILFDCIFSPYLKYTIEHVHITLLLGVWLDCMINEN